jgi:uncharacterized repeat protein (TIGR01451 family)
MRRSLNGWRFLAGRGRGRRTATLSVLAIVVGVASSVVGGGVSAASPAKADMAISSISDGPDPVLTGQRVTYDVGVENFGPGQATGVTLTTMLPAGVSFSSEWSGSNCAEAGGVVTCSWSSLPAGVGAVELITVTAPSTPGLLQLTFTVSAAERDPDLSNNSQTVTTTVVQPTEAGLSINLPDSVAGYAGQNFIWLTVGVGNAGPAVATGVTVTLLFPPGLSPGYGGGVCTETGSGLSCRYSLGSLGTGPGVVFLIGVLASAAGSYTVQGSVTADQPDPVLSNNSASTLVTVTPAADLSAQIVGSLDPATPGAAITYAVTVTNHGPSPASAVALSDTWSSTVAGGVQLLSFGTTQGQCALSIDQRIDCQLGELASGATTTVSVTVRARGTGAVTDQAQVSGAEFDPDTTNNTATLTTTVGQA